VCAIAGLPNSPRIQHHLLCRPTVDILSTILSAELNKKPADTTLLNACLYALLRLIQCSPAETEDPHLPDALRALVTKGALAATSSIPLDVRQIAFCVKSRIILLLCDDIGDKTPFEMDLPLLIKSCADTHLRRLLSEVHLLWRSLSHAEQRPPLLHPRNDFLSLLKAPNTTNRNKVHEELVKAATSGSSAYIFFQGSFMNTNVARNLVVTVEKFGAQPLLDGLTTISSTELRRRYAALFAELATDCTCAYSRGMHC
jgi:hypothetical protein